MSVKQGGIKYHFWVFGMTRPGIEPRSLGPLANTLTARPMCVCVCVCVCLRERERERERERAKMYEYKNTAFHWKVPGYCWRDDKTEEHKSTGDTDWIIFINEPRDLILKYSTFKRKKKRKLVSLVSSFLRLYISSYLSPKHSWTISSSPMIINPLVVFIFYIYED